MVRDQNIQVKKIATMLYTNEIICYWHICFFKLLNYLNYNPEEFEVFQLVEKIYH
jgi:hypothetical protein